jgi:antitoxin PrlF
MPAATITSKGQVTIPKAVRESLGVGRGDRLTFKLRPNGSVTLTAEKPQPPTRILGLLEKYRRKEAVTVEAMDDAVGRRAAARQRETWTK